MWTRPTGHSPRESNDEVTSDPLMSPVLYLCPPKTPTPTLLVNNINFLKEQTEALNCWFGQVRWAVNLDPGV